VVALYNGVVVPTHTIGLPVFAGSVGFTVTTAVRIQPEVLVYVITAVPVPTPVTTPPGVIVATAVLPLLQLQPAVVELSVVEVPRQIPKVPVIGAGSGLTVTEATLAQPLGSI
jgi:hypothetical protein